MALAPFRGPDFQAPPTSDPQACVPTIRDRRGHDSDLEEVEPEGV
jgi:hypothetical protein